MSGADALLVIGLIALALAFGAFVIVLRRIPARTQPAVEPNQLADQQAERATGQAQAEAEQVRSRAQADADKILSRAAEAAEQLARQAEDGRRKAEDEVSAIKDEIRQLRGDLERREQRIGEREQRLDDESRRLEARGQTLDARRNEIEERAKALTDADARAKAELERVAALTADQARAELVAAIENQAKREAAVSVRDIEATARTEADKRARKIVTLAIQRVAVEQTSESVVSVMHLPGEEMKGRIIGREGRNIRAFESVTGVNLIIDDTPEAVLLSCFDPVRREIGRLTLERLVADGRIHPQRIEEAYERGKAEIEQICQRAGEDAMTGLGITDMHPEMISLLGRLRYRTSYGQNVLGHLIESAHIAGMMASELGLNPVLLRRCAVLHDIGKALTHEVEGSHALIGAEIARKYGESEDVVHAIEAHHNEVEVRTVEAVLTQAADSISGGRPGARRESLEMYVRRLERLEQIAAEKEGVEKVFAMQAGREIRVMVKPEQVDDIQAQVIARDIAKQVEEELTYPGQIRVTVVRESRATEFAR
ncbi:ribonuclease Y [Trebonia kvetii]|uniref:Ribonuclease Y n=1 Tax=Trebonia kvetii TaxID=2480626 RepID=A0A6P2C4J0_9ACTN|nr:ribonuclease Y [Trebonia kvetii]TVZ06090.1 ribonuclease Y [Trebonia kvetii]